MIIPINKEGILQFKKRYKFLSIERILFYIGLKSGEYDVSIFQRGIYKILRTILKLWKRVNKMILF